MHTIAVDNFFKAGRSIILDHCYKPHLKTWSALYLINDSACKIYENIFLRQSQRILIAKTLYIILFICIL